MSCCGPQPPQSPFTAPTGPQPGRQPPLSPSGPHQGLQPPHSLLRTPSEPSPDPQLPQDALGARCHPLRTTGSPLGASHRPPYRSPAGSTRPAGPAGPAGPKPRPFRRYGKGATSCRVTPPSQATPLNQATPLSQDAPSIRPRPLTRPRPSNQATPLI